LAALTAFLAYAARPLARDFLTKQKFRLDDPQRHHDYGVVYQEESHIMILFASSLRDHLSPPFFLAFLGQK
jgi:hypothetical protein